MSVAGSDFNASHLNVGDENSEYRSGQQLYRAEFPDFTQSLQKNTGRVPPSRG
jgi:hypothetical protein